MRSVKKLLAFLTTLWGLLAAAAVAFPGAAALLKVPLSVENSRIALLYPIIGTVVSAFSTLLLISYQDRLSDLAFARRLAIRAMGIALACFFAFVSVRVVLLDVSSTGERLAGPTPGSQVIIRRDRGVIEVEKRDNTWMSLEKRGDPLDILTLALFTATFASLTVGFSALGIHTQSLSQKKN